MWRGRGTLLFSCKMNTQFVPGKNLAKQATSLLNSWLRLMQPVGGQLLKVSNIQFRKKPAGRQHCVMLSSLPSSTRKACMSACVWFFHSATMLAISLSLTGGMVTVIHAESKSSPSQVICCEDGEALCFASTNPTLSRISCKWSKSVCAAALELATHPKSSF